MLMLPSSIFALLSAAGLASSAAISSRQTTSTQEKQSAPFNLILQSAANSTLDGRQLFAGHAGAAIEELIIGNKTILQEQSSVFTFNTSSYASSSTPTQIGQLVWTLATRNLNLSSPLNFVYSPAYDTAVPTFEPSDASVYLAFTAEDNLVYYEYTDNRTSPYKTLDRWYACQLSPFQSSGYSYFALAWALGSDEPDNKTCQKVSVKRLNVTA